MRPDNPDMMYVTDAWAGVHVSTNGGQTWFPSNEDITTRAGESGVTVQPPPSRKLKNVPTRYAWALFKRVSR